MTRPRPAARTPAARRPAAARRRRTDGAADAARAGTEALHCGAPLAPGGLAMTWQVASFGVLALALAAGFAWYERARPSAKLLALVATLAALAALGRIAFAPMPSVKPTTDIVLFAGYALGGAPGFVVGAVAALASNVFFGQGPFTPWQMVGWGAVGVFGAVLARVFGRRPRALAAGDACALAGLAYGSFLDFHLWVTYSAHSWDEYLLVAGRGVPFNITHAASNVVFCLAFGPLLVRSLERYRDRLEVTWHPLPAGSGGGVRRSSRRSRWRSASRPRRGRAPARLGQPSHPGSGDRVPRVAQNGDGGFGGDRGRGSDPLYTSWASWASPRRGATRARCGPQRALGRRLPRAQHRPARGIGDVERAILALHAGRRSVRSIGGRNLVARADPQAPLQRLVCRARQPDGVRDPRAARRRAARPATAPSAPRPAGSRASTTATVGSTSPARAARAASTTPPRPCRGSRPPASAPRRR